MQGTEGQDQVPTADFDSVSRQPAAGFPHDGEGATQSISFVSEAMDRDPRVHHDDDERDDEPELTSGQHVPELNIHCPNLYPLAHIAEVNERRYGLFARAQSASAAQRMEFQHQLDNFQYILDRLQSSVGALTSGVTGGRPEPAPKRPKGRLKKLERRFRTDAEELTRHIQSTAMLMTRMREGDRHVEEVGDALHNSLQAMSTTLRRNESDQDDHGLMHTSVSLVPTPPSSSIGSNAARFPMADELAKFCDAVANFKIMRERIDELYFEKQEQEQRRDFLGDQELKLEKRNERFLLTWNESLANAEMEFKEAEAAVSRARKLCEDANVLIPPWAETNPAFSEIYQEYNIPAQLATIDLPEGVILPRSSDAGVGSSMNSSEPVLLDALSLMSNPFSEHPSSDDKIANWIESVEPDVTDPSSGLPPLPISEDISSTIEYRFAQLRTPRP